MIQVPRTYATFFSMFFYFFLQKALISPLAGQMRFLKKLFFLFEIIFFRLFHQKTCSYMMSKTLLIAATTQQCYYAFTNSVNLLGKILHMSTRYLSPEQLLSSPRISTPKMSPDKSQLFYLIYKDGKEHLTLYDISLNSKAIIYTYIEGTVVDYFWMLTSNDIILVRNPNNDENTRLSHLSLKQQAITEIQTQEKTRSFYIRTHSIDPAVIAFLNNTREESFFEEY